MVLLDGILFGLLAIYVLTCIYRNIFQYRVFGLRLGLLIGIEIGLVAAI